MRVTVIMPARNRAEGPRQALLRLQEQMPEAEMIENDHGSGAGCTRSAVRAKVGCLALDPFCAPIDPCPRLLIAHQALHIYLSTRVVDHCLHPVYRLGIQR